MPATIGDEREDEQRPDRPGEDEEVHADDQQDREDDPERDADHGADQRRDHALSETIHRTCQRVMPTARSIPSSRVRS